MWLTFVTTNLPIFHYWMLNWLWCWYEYKWYIRRNTTLYLPKTQSQNNYFKWMLHIKNLKLSQTRAGLDLSFPSSIWSQKSSRLLRYVKALRASAAILLSTRLPWVVPWPGCFRLSPRARTAKYTLSSKRRSVTICFFCVRVLSFAFVLAAFNAFLANTLVSLAWLLWWAKTFAFWALTCLDLEKEQNYD